MASVFGQYLAAGRTAGFVSADVSTMANLLAAVAVLGFGTMRAAAKDATSIADLTGDVCTFEGDYGRGRAAHHSCSQDLGSLKKRRHVAHEMVGACARWNVVHNAFTGVRWSGGVNGDVTRTVFEVNAGY